MSTATILGFLCVVVAISVLFACGIALERLFTKRRSQKPLAPASEDGRVLPTVPSRERPSTYDRRDAVAKPLPFATLPYTRQPDLLTRAERDFFAVLRAAAPPGWYVFPQVRLANLVTLRKDTRNWKPHFSKIAAKCVDFVLCDERAISPQLVVELDDSSHNRADRQARDAFVDAALRSAGLPILHVRWQPRYDAEELATAIYRAAGLPVASPPPIAPAPTLTSSASILAAPRQPRTPAMFD
ncbi:MAG: DUF2726 domain-containing protein, partial [Oscillochloris sp.]|nr:DUF2726 domain-containing protein [Oscillochloris sp.]